MLTGSQVINLLEDAKQIIIYCGHFTNTFRAPAEEAASKISQIQQDLKALESTDLISEKYSLSKKLRDALNQFEIKTLHLRNIHQVHSIHDALFNAKIALAELCPLNQEDPISQESIADENRVFVSTGHQFDISLLFQSHITRDYRVALGEKNSDNKKYLLNPITNSPFGYLDLKHIKKIADEKNISVPNNVKELDVLLISTMTTDPELRQSLGNAIQFKRIVKSLSDAIAIMKQRPSLSQKIYTRIMDTSFINAIEININFFEIKALVEQYPYHIDDIYQKLMHECLFKKLHKIDFRVVLEMFSVFPKYREEIYQQIMSTKFDPENFDGLLSVLREPCPNHLEEIYQATLLLRNNNFNEIDIINLLTIFPDYAESIYVDCIPRFNHLKLAYPSGRDEIRDRICAALPHYAKEINERWEILLSQKEQQKRSKEYGFSSRSSLFYPPSSISTLPSEIKKENNENKKASEISAKKNNPPPLPFFNEAKLLGVPKVGSARYNYHKRIGK